MTRSEFMSQAKPLAITVNGQQVYAEPKTFSTGSVGYHFQGKVMVDGVKVQANLLLTAVGSKEWAD